ncbi:MAG: hypothetical protein E7586_06290 [Ruminococcaceae bacterium]|nr:hypothetical protein [Oscillospiraceae bacterium]
MKKFLSLILCIIFCVSALAGCNKLEEEEKGANIRMFLTDYPHSLDPAVIQPNGDVDQILSLIFEPLTRIDADGKVQPALATEWYGQYDDIYQLHKMYFVLKDTSWSDNRKVSADDVVYAWSRILSPEVDSPYASLLFGIKGARTVKSGVGTIDDLGLAAVNSTLLEVTFEYDYNCELFAEQVANIHLAPCREDVVARLGDAWASSAADIVCNGAFRVQAMDMPTAENTDSACKLVLERNAFYLREDGDALDKFVNPYRITCYYYEGQYKYYENEANSSQKVFQASRFLNGEIYYLSAFEPQTYQHFKDDLETANTLNGFAFYFNTENELLKDADVRKAFSAALDRNEIVGATTGTGEIAATGYVPNGVFNTDRKSDFRTEGGSLYNTSADLDTAKSLVSGKEKGTLTVSYLIPENSTTRDKFSKKVSYNNVYWLIAAQAGEYWKSLGYTIEFEGLYPDEYTEALKTRNYDIIGVNVLSGSVDAFNYLAPFAKEYSGSSITVDNSVASVDEEFNPHYTNFDSADYSEIITSALKTNDRAERASLLHKAEEMLVDECPATMVFWYTRSFVASKEIKGYDCDSWFGYMDFTDLQLKDWRDVNASEEALLESRK